MAKAVGGAVSSKRAGTPDKYANKFYGSVVESAANTLTFDEIPTNIDIFSKAAWVLERLEWFIDQTYINYIGVADDKIQCALTASENISTLALSEPALIDLFELSVYVFGTPATAELVFQPFQRDFTSMNGGGLLVSPRPLFLAVKGTSLANPVTVSCRGYYRQLVLTPAEYLDLVDFYRLLK